MHTHFTSFALRLLAVVSLAAIAGCGSGRPNTVSVEGTVTLGGKPVDGAAVMLIPDGQGKPASGQTDHEGKFLLKTFEAGDGAMPGKYKVTVSLVKVSGVKADADGLSGEVEPGGIKKEYLVPEKYGDPKTSGLTAEVKSGMEPLELKLTAD